MEGAILEVEKAELESGLDHMNSTLWVMAGVSSCLMVSATQWDNEDTIQETLGMTLKTRDKPCGQVTARRTRRRRALGALGQRLERHAESRLRGQENWKGRGEKRGEKREESCGSSLLPSLNNGM
ncbi:hypothetical protein INR49_032591 [Caranx melampygus]|nr:hypothetical protein INR49_032591 [Caranx melampygus]